MTVTCPFTRALGVSARGENDFQEISRKSGGHSGNLRSLKRKPIGQDQKLRRSLVPTTGRVSALLRAAAYVADDAMLDVARRQNPDDGLPPSA